MYFTDILNSDKPALESAGLGSLVFDLMQLLFQSEFSVELIDASAGVYKLLLARIEWVAFGTYFYLYVFPCASRFDSFTAGAFDCRLLVIRMYPLFQSVHGL